MSQPAFRVIPGIERLPAPLLARARRIGLVAHPASRTSSGVHSADYLLHTLHLPLAALFGPEHGFYGRAAPGAPIASGRDPATGLPIHSLYGDTRSPTDAMLDGLDLIIFDLQSLACRAYTYGSTLRLVMEACAAHHLPLLVADRPDPLMLTPPDGPMLDPAHSSFVALLPTPFQHGLTLGETALYLKSVLPLPSLDLTIAPFAKERDGGNLFTRAAAAAQALEGLQALFPAPFPSPSPSIQNVQSALCFPATVFMEALPHLSHARPTPFAFQHLSSPDIDLAALLSDIPPQPGIELTPATDPATNRPSIHLAVTDPARYRPAQTARALLRPLEAAYRPLGGLWATPNARPEWLLKLLGAPRTAPFLPPALFTPPRIY